MNPSKDVFGTILIFTLFLLLIVAGVISYKSIDWTVLNRLEQQPLVLPTPIPSIPTQATSSAN